MAEEIALASSQMTDPDLRAIATYLKDGPAEASAGVPLAANDPVMTAGQAIYRDECSACHAPDGRGVANLFPAFADAPYVRSTDPSSLIRVVLRGARTVATPGEPTGPGMPALGWQLDDAQVAAVLTYVRNAWGGAGSAITAGAVTKAGAALATRTD